MRKELKPSYSYIESKLTPEGPEKLTARHLSADLGLSGISISQTEAHLIQFLCHMVKPKKIVEIGTLTGLSALYFLESLTAKGQLWTFEKSKDHVLKAQVSLKSALENKTCQIIEGDAIEMLPTIENQGPFDAIFIDGNKAAYYQYWKWAEKNIAVNGLIIIDNVFLAGAVWGDMTQQKFSEKQVQAVQKMTDEILNSKNFRCTFIPTEEGLLLAHRI